MQIGIFQYFVEEQCLFGEFEVPNVSINTVFLIYWAKKEIIHFCNYNHFFIRTKTFNSIRIYYSPPLSAMD